MVAYSGRDHRVLAVDPDPQRDLERRRMADVTHDRLREQFVRDEEARAKKRMQQSEIWQHIKSGGLYTVIGHGLIEADLSPATIYKSLWDGAVWVRPTAEFEDGRFLNLAVDEVTDCRPGEDRAVP